jgi:RNA polymerase sigma factor (sigma-70 family)
VTPAEIVRRSCAEQLAAVPVTELLSRYATRGDADAFAGLVRHFGPLVLGVCQRVLGSAPDADDAFQTVFLALARQARSFRDARSLPAWLHRVSLRTARKALARRPPDGLAAAPGAAEPPARGADPFAEVAWKDVRRVLDEELDALPARYRGPVVLCWLDGLTQDEAAGRLGLSLNTLKRRLDAGRSLLRARLARRGLAPVLVAAAVVAPGGLRADVPRTLAQTVARALGEWKPPAPLLPRLVWVITTVAVAACGAALVGPDREAPEGAPVPRPALPPERPDERAALPLPPGAVARFGSTHFRAEEGITAALSPDGQRLAVVGNSSVRVYEAATWRRLQTLAEGLEISSWRSDQALAFSPDGQRLAFRDGVRYAHVWDLKTGQLVHRFDSGNADELRSVCAFAPDGLLALSDRDSFRFYDPATGKENRSVGAARVVALSPDGKYFVRSTPDPAPIKLFLCETATGKDLHAFETPVQHWPTVTFSPDGKRLALVAQDGSALEVWDADKRVLVKRLPAPEKTHPEYRWRYAGGLTPDGSEVWLALHSGDVARWNATTFRELPRLKAGADQAPKQLLPLPDGRTLLAPCDYDWVRVFDRATGRERTIPDRYGWDTYFALSPDGEFVATGDESGRIDLLDATTGKLVRTLRATGAPVQRLVFGPDGAVLGVGDGLPVGNRKNLDSTVRALWADGKALWARSAETAANVWSLYPLGFTDEDRAVVAHYPDHVRTWNTRTGQEVYRLSVRGHHAVVCPAGRFLASADDDAVVVFDLRTGRQAKRIEIEPEKWAQKPVPADARFAWSADGLTLVTTRPGGRISVLDPVAGKERTRFTAHDLKLETLTEDPWWRNGAHSVRALALSPDGKRLLASARHGRYVALWDTRTGKQLAKLAPGFPIDAAAFGPDGKSVFTFGGRGLGYRWDVEKVLAK